MDEFVDKPRTYRERKTYTKKDKYSEKELHHPVHAPYKRPTKDVIKNEMEKDSE